MATIEDIYSVLVKEGVNRGLSVVPEFCVSDQAHSFTKIIDIAWLRPRNDPARVGSLKRWEIVAAFEIEGYDVKLDRLKIHSEQFLQLRIEEGKEFPCFVPLYNHALHRNNPKWSSDTPDIKIREREAEAKKLGDVIHVLDGRKTDYWLMELPR